jgi:hypothetical protein
MDNFILRPKNKRNEETSCIGQWTHDTDNFYDDERVGRETFILRLVKFNTVLQLAVNFPRKTEEKG